MEIPVVRVLSQTRDRTVVRVDFPVASAPFDWFSVPLDSVRFALPGTSPEPADDPASARAELPPRLNLTLAVPTLRAPDVQVADVRWWREPDRAPDLASLAVFSAPAVCRSVPVTGCSLPLAVDGGVLAGVTLVIEHRRSADHGRLLERAESADTGLFGDVVSAADMSAAEVPAGVLNPDLFALLAKGGGLRAREKAAAKRLTPDPFTATSHWVTLPVPATGLYRVTGQQLAGYGVAAGGIDPGKLRLYRGGGLALEMDPEFPDSLQADRSRLNEVAIDVVDGGDGEWNLDDEIRFYGVSTSTWRDRLAPGADRLNHYDHPFADQAVYWLTWEDDATPSPLPGIPRRVATVEAPGLGGQVVETCRLRLHQEQQVVDSPGVFADNWAWMTAISSSRTATFDLRTPAPGTAAEFVVDVRGNFAEARWETYAFEFTAEAWLNGDRAAAGITSFTYYTQADSQRVRVGGSSAAVVGGANALTIANSSAQGQDTRLDLILDSFDVLYWAPLELPAGSGQLEFAHWRDQVAAPSSATDFVVTHAAGAPLLIWDVSHPDSALAIAGTATAEWTRWGVLRDQDSDRHFVICRPADLLTVTGGARVLPTPLAAVGGDVDYVVIAPQSFAPMAEDLADFRSRSVPGVASPVARAFAVEAIYGSYSGGQKDPAAIRNFLKHLYESGGHRLRYVCFLGKATRDYRNHLERTPFVDLYDLLPTVVRTRFPVFPVSATFQTPYASDDALVSFDSPPVAAGDAQDLDFPDLACGRLPARNSQEARAMVAMTIAYHEAPETGPWRNQVLLTADDTFRPTEGFRLAEDRHLREAEDLAANYLPGSLDVRKVYGSAYSFPASSTVKAAARIDINAALNAGTTMFYYVGHGAEDNLADEQIFRTDDIANLGNGARRPLFVAFSCDVGVYDSPKWLSMAEEFLISPSGGAVGTICASQVSYSGENDAITEAFFRNQFPGRRVTTDRTVGEALRLGKGEMGGLTLRANSQRYNLMGDPALRLPHPLDDLVLAPASLDTLRAGARQTVVLARDGNPAVVSGDRYRLQVQESAAIRSYVAMTVVNPAPNPPTVYTRTWVAPGAAVFRGEGTQSDGDLIIPFKVPSQIRYGDGGRVRLIVETPDGDHAAVRTVPAVRGSTGVVDDLHGPLIRLTFGDGRFRVRPGDPLTATLTDTSGIAILGTSPGNSLLLELDDSGRMSNLTASFVYDPDSFTSGTLVFPLPADLASGAHRAALHASDALGNVGSDTLSFVIIPGGVAGIEGITPFPNPTPGPCRLLFELSDPMAVQWDIYTVAGRRIRSLREAFTEAGPRILEWDGRDAGGDEIANGTYLYVLRGTGAATDGHEITKTGKLVILR